MADLGAIGMVMDDIANAHAYALSNQSLSISNVAIGGIKQEAASFTAPSVSLAMLYPSLPGVAQGAGDGTKRTVSGTVYATGAPVAGCTVHAFRRSDGALLGSAVSDGSGNFSISIYGETSAVNVIAYDPAGGTSYNDVIISQITPM